MDYSTVNTVLPEVAIVGRPNVGKSTLFNRVVGRRQAIVGSEPGLTRDRHYAEADWSGRRFALVDTGGLDRGSRESIPLQVERQVRLALETADVVMLVVDARDGLVPVEAEIVQIVRRRGLPVVLVANKCDTPAIAAEAVGEFHVLGVGEVYPISAEHGRGVSELLDALLEHLPGEGAPEQADGAPVVARIAVVGRPNVGKSSLVNALLGSSRVIVSDEPGTTRDAIDSIVEHGGRRYLLIDTAGIRKRSRLDTHAELASVATARRRLRRADVALLLVDPIEGVTRQDLHVAREARDLGCGLILVAARWDTVQPEPGLEERFADYARQRLGRMAYAPVLFTSAVRGDGIDSVLPTVDRVVAARARRVPTGKLNAVFEAVMRRNVLPGGSSPSQPKYLTQIGIDPPTFVVFLPGRGGFRRDYRRYLENRLRASFDFTGTPLVVRLRRRSLRGSRGRR